MTTEGCRVCAVLRDQLFRDLRFLQTLHRPDGGQPRPLRTYLQPWKPVLAPGLALPCRAASAAGQHVRRDREGNHHRIPGEPRPRPRPLLCQHGKHPQAHPVGHFGAGPVLCVALIFPVLHPLRAEYCGEDRPGQVRLRRRVLCVDLLKHAPRGPSYYYKLLQKPYMLLR